MNRSPAGEETLVFIGYMHVSKLTEARWWTCSAMRSP